MFRDPNLDALAVKMLAATEGDGEPWRRLTRALRDDVLEHARRTSPYYRRVIEPGMPFEEVPILTKALLRARAPELLSEGIPPERRVRLSSSGSSDTGAVRFCRDATQGPTEDGSGQRALRALQGIPEHAVMVWVAAAPRPTPGDAPAGGMIPRGPRRPPVVQVPTRSLQPRGIRRLLRRCARLAPYFLYGPPSALHDVADVAEADGLPLPPVAVVGTGETMSDDGRARLGRAFAAPVHAWYGSNEVSGYLGGTLPGGRRFAFNPLLAHVELLDGAGRPARPGTEARVVVTDLNNYVMPFIRYDLGDVALTPREDAWRGGWRIADRIVARSWEALRLRGGRRLTTVLLDDLILSAALTPRVRRWQCAQIAPSDVELRVVWDSEARSAEMRERLERGLRDLVGPAVTARVVAVDRLERLPSGTASVLLREAP